MAEEGGRTLWEGGALGLDEQVLTDGLVIFKRCTSQLRREKPPPGNREKEQNRQGRALVEYPIPEKGKSAFTVGLALTYCCL